MSRIDEALERGRVFVFTVDGQKVEAFPGETVAAALLAGGAKALRQTAKRGQPRSLYCGMGICWECLVMVDGAPSQRACMTEAKPGMRVETQLGVGR